MRRFGIICLAVVMLFGLAGCSIKAKNPTDTDGSKTNKYVGKYAMMRIPYDIQDKEFEDFVSRVY